MTVFAEFAACCLIGYLLGNLSPSYVLGKRKGYDVRKDGSGNAGATNTFILMGAKAFFLTTFADILKAFAAYKLCEVFFRDIPFAGALGGTACIIGHIYPALMGFKGGKGLACLGGTVLGWSWKWFIVLLAFALLIAFVTRYVSLAAPVISVVFPACHYWQTRLLPASLILLTAAVPIILKHRENFRRILAGTEMRPALSETRKPSSNVSACGTRPQRNSLSAAGSKRSMACRPILSNRSGNWLTIILIITLYKPIIQRIV